jgi:proteasome component ECM29
MLNFIIPTRQWSLFMSGRQHDTDGIARTVALLVVATGDAHPNVVERAALALKAHLDVMRERHEDTQAISALGEPISLSCTLLSLILGDSIAERALTQMDGGFSEMESLSLRQGTLDNAMHDISQQTLLSTKRRMASNQTAAAIMSFVSKVLDENPSWLHHVGDKKTRALSTLSVLSASKLLATTTGLLTLSTLRATPYIAAAQLLNALVIRLTALDAPPVTLLGKTLCTVCNVLLAQAAMPRPSIHSNFGGTAEGSIAMRDACYGVICTLCRSRHAENYIFTCGRDDKDTENHNNGITSMETAKLLFACAANEEETLRPRAVAALDALLGAYCRVYVTSTSAVLKRSNVKDVMSRMEIDEPEPSNPWSQIEAPMVSDAKMQVVATAYTSDLARTSDNQGLARALLPLLWSAAQSSQPKASRVAAARWSSDLLKSLDLPNACHILCFLAGDKDVTAASIARDGLGLDKTIGEAYDEHQVDSSASLPDFSDFTVALFSESSKSTSTSWRPRYYDFSHHAKAAALRFGLTCLLSDLYGGEDEAVASYVGALCETLTYFGTASSGRGSAHGRESIDLLDECSICLAGCLSTSRFARSMILSGRTTFGLEDMEALALLADSSKARRYLAEACGCIFEDCDLWQDQGAQISMTDWVNKSHILRALKICGKKLSDMQTEVFQVSEVHGAAFLGARCCRAFRVLYSKKESDATASVDECWNLIDSIIDSLGRGTLNSDETVGNAFSLALSIALSFDGNDAPLLDTRIYAGTTSVLTSLDTALRKYGNGDHTDEARASSLANAAGIVLAASTSAAGFVADNSTPNRNVGPARIQCVDALFSLIGSNAFRKDPEIALVAGEALSDYADAYGSDSVVWESAFTDWPDTYSEDYANNLPPHQQVSVVLQWSLSILLGVAHRILHVFRFCTFC